MGRIVTVSGPRGVGKTTIIDSLRDSHNIPSIAPFTTREMRSGEVDGRDYIFVKRDVFEDLAADGSMFDVLEVRGNLYGTPVSAIDEVLESDTTKTFNIAADTALRLRKYGAGLVRSVMILPASWDDIRNQMRASGISEVDIQYRIDHEPTDLSLLPRFDRLIVNRQNYIQDTINETLAYIKSL